MDVNPQPLDPQSQSPLQGEREQQSQFGMQGQADMPNQPPMGAQYGGATQPAMKSPGRSVGPRDIMPGAEVYGSDGKKLGTIEEVFDDSFLVQKGILFVHDYYLPYSFVAGISTERVDLNLTSDDVKNQDLSSRPGLGARSGAAMPDASDASGADQSGMPGLEAPPPGQDQGVYGPQGPADTIQGATYGGTTGVDPNAAMPPSGVMNPNLPGSGAMPRGGTPVSSGEMPAHGTPRTDQGMGAGAGGDYGTQMGTPTPMRGQTQPDTEQGNVTGTPDHPDLGPWSPNDPHQDRGVDTP